MPILRAVCNAAALPHMMSVLNSRPHQFSSIQAAVDWAVHTGMCKSQEAAGVSVPSQLQQHADGVWRWRTPLHESRQSWEGWYTGLSEQFLKLPVPKMLLLAGTDR